MKSRLTAASAVYAFVAMFAAVLASSPVSSAGEFTARSCHLSAHRPVESTADWWNYFIGGQNWKKTESCPYGIGFDTSVAGQFNETDDEWRIDFGGTPIRRIKFRHVGGSSGGGAVYAVSACSECDMHVITPSEVIAEDTHDFHPETSRVVLSLKCVTDYCPPQPGMKFFDFEITLNDSSPPVVPEGRGFVEYTPNNGSPPTRWNAWNAAGQVGAKILVGDEHGSGLSLTTLDVNGDVIETLSEHCDISYYVFHDRAFPCPRSAPDFNKLLDLRHLADGWHTLTLRSEDAVGNAMDPMRVQFGLDTTSPNTPEDPIVTDTGPYGWTNTESIGIDWRNSGEQRESRVESGVNEAWYDVNPRTDDEQAVDPPPVHDSPQSDHASFHSIPLPADGLWDVYVWTRDAVGNSSGKLKLTVGRDRDQPGAPVLLANPWFSRANLTDGRFQNWRPPENDPALESGICGYSFSVDGSIDSQSSGEIVRGGAITSAAIPPNTPSGTSYAHVRAVSCSGISSPATTTEIKVDDTPPSVMSGPQHEDWQTSLSVLTISGRDLESGIEALEYRLNDAPPIVVPSDSAKIPVGEGVHRIAFFAVDRAGNRSASEVIRLRVDHSPPSATFERRDPLRPARLVAVVGDRISGVRDAWIEYRRFDSNDPWRQVPNGTAAPVSPGASLRLTAEIPDDTLPAGNYGFRIRAIDVAGNIANADADEFGDAPMNLRLPIRERTQVRAGIAMFVKSCHTVSGRTCGSRSCVRGRRSRCRVSWRIDGTTAKPTQLVSYGSRSALVGELLDDAGTPIPNADLELVSMERFGHASVVGTLTSDAEGRFTREIDPGATRRFTVRVASNERSLGAEQSADLAVRAGVKFSVARRAVSTGQTVRFSGRLLSGASSIPAAGKIVQLQWRNGRIWQDLALRRTDSRGRFGMAFAFNRPLTRPTRVVFRAFVVKESMWPYEDGWSDSVSVLVRP